MIAEVDLGGFAPPAHLQDLRAEVRDFLRTERGAGSYVRSPAGWDQFCPEFSRKVGARGWIGMSWPSVYGGHERSALERYVVTEELLAAGAPVRAHWLADRQIGPLLLRHGSEAQKREYLPRIAAGTCYFCVGLSEPDSGSDLASIRTRAEPAANGWRVNGTKLWTSYAHRATMMNLFARTAPRSDDRHAGVTQFLVDLTLPGITIRPIRNLADEHDFNEVTFEDVMLPGDSVIGEVGGGWTQVSGELAHERSGSERWIDTYGALVRMIDMAGDRPDARMAEQIGSLVARLWTLHRMSFSIAGLLDRGGKPDVVAALVKDLGNQFEKDVPEAARRLFGESLRRDDDGGDGFFAMLDRATFYAPSFTIRGGTREILRGIIARGLGLR
jgi:acyl-CoA dehydrogenase